MTPGRVADPAYDPGSDPARGSAAARSSARRRAPPASVERTSPQGHLPALDGFRGLAALSVFFFHYGGGLRSTMWPVRLLGSVAAVGWSGVTAFFVLSGFLISSSLLASAQPLAAQNPQGTLRGFYLRRVRRIVPLYLAAITAAAICAAAARASRGQLAALLPYAAFMQNVPGLVRIADHAPGPLPLFHLWSVAVEAQFYVLWPPVLLWAARRGAASKLCLAAFAGSLLFRCLAYAQGMPGDTAQLAASLPLHLGSFALGAMLASLSRTDRWSALVRLAPLGVAAGIVAFLLAAHHGGTIFLASPAQFTLGLAGLGLVAASLLALALRPGPVARALSLQPLPWLGRISYGLYVFHVLLRPIVDRASEQVSQANHGFAFQSVRLLVALPLSLAAAWLSYTLLETPWLRNNHLHSALTPPNSSALHSGVPSYSPKRVRNQEGIPAS